MFAYSDAEHLFSSSSSSSIPAFLAMLTIIPILIAVSSGPVMVKASQEFTVYRMQEYDFQSSSHGCRNSLLNLEARTLQQTPQSFARKCIIVKLKYLIDNRDVLDDLLSETFSGGLLVLVPHDLRQLTPEEESSLMELEKRLLSSTVQIPVYFAPESAELSEIYNEIELSTYGKGDNISGFERIFNSVVANGYQIVVSSTQTSPIKNPVFTTIEGKLVGKGLEEQIPTIAVVAHYDAFSSVPGLTFGADSNGSGVVALLELARIFAKLYSNPRTHPGVNVIFLLSAAGKFSYFGTKKWIEHHLDSSESSLLSECMFAVCLESVSDVENSNELHMHVSKPPKPNTAAASFYSELRDTAEKSSVNVSMVHKKINLADEHLAWEHERFSIRRLPAFTISSLNNHKSQRRGTVVDTFERVSIDHLTKNIEIIAEALTRQIFSLSNQTSDVFDVDLGVSRSFVESTLRFLASEPRAQQLLLSAEKGSSSQMSSVINTLHLMLKKYVKEVEVYNFKTDKREPEVVFYEPVITKMNAYNIKPAVFDFFLSVAILIYLGVLYLVLTNFHYIQSLTKVVKTTVTGTQNGYISHKGKQQ